MDENFRNGRRAENHLFWRKLKGEGDCKNKPKNHQRLDSLKSYNIDLFHDDASAALDIIIGNDNQPLENVEGIDFNSNNNIELDPVFDNVDRSDIENESDEENVE